MCIRDRDQVHGTRPEEEVQFNFLGVDERGPLGGGGLDGGEQNNVEMMEDLSNFEWLGTAESWVEETQVKRL